MRGIGAAAAAARRHTHLPSSYAAAFSSFSGIGGGGGAGRGRGRGLPPSAQPRAPGSPIPHDDDGADPFSAPASVGRGRGEPVIPSSPIIPSFSSLSGAGRGRGSPLPPPPSGQDAPKQPTFTKRFDDIPPSSDPEPPTPGASSSKSSRSLPTSGAGRGVPRMQQPVDRPPEENRFIRRREAKQAASPSAPGGQPKLSSQDAVKRALELLGRGDDGGRGDRGGCGCGSRRGRGRGRRSEVDERHGVYLGDNADGEKLEKKLGVDKMKILNQAFDEAAENALPHPKFTSPTTPKCYGGTRRKGRPKTLGGRRPQPSPSLRRRGAMASLAPRLLRRRLVLSAAALSSIRDSWMPLHGACSPRLGPFFRRSWWVAGSDITARRWWFHPPVRYGSTAVTLNTDGGFARFAVSDACAKQKEGRKQLPAKKKMSRKAKVNQLKWYRLKAKKKMKSPNPEVRIRYKLEKAKRKEEWLILKLRKYEVPRAPEPVHDPEILTEEEIFYLKRTGEKRNNYVPVGRRGVFGGVVLNMHLHWKKHETVKVVCKPCRPGQVYEYTEDLARLSKGTVIDIKPNNTIIFYRGKNYVQPKVMSPPDTLSKQKALEKYRYEQSLEHTSQFIENLEKELEDYQKHVALFKNREGAISEKISNKDTTVDDLTTSSDTE